MPFRRWLLSSVVVVCAGCGEPAQVESAEREKPTIGKNWSVILDRALARQADDRFPDAVALRDAIKEELARIGVTAPRTELEAWFDDPEGYTEEHGKRMISTLCDLGDAARKRGESLAAASDYNRALAYAPNDPQLLRIVATMHRACATLRGRGAQAVLLKGGHLAGGDAVVDVFADARGVREIRHPRLAIEAHGTGCTLASAIAARLALGDALDEACVAASDYVHRALATGYRPGRSDVVVLDHFGAAR